MATRKLQLSRPNRMAHRLVKAANALNSMAELFAETTVTIQDAANNLLKVAEEIEEQDKEDRK